MRNCGQIANLSEGTPVETWAVADASGIQPELAGEVPAVILPLLQNLTTEINLSTDAALTGDRRLAEQAVYISAMLHRKDKAAELTRRLLDVHAQMLPQFFKK